MPGLKRSWRTCPSCRHADTDADSAAHRVPPPPAPLNVRVAERRASFPRWNPTLRPQHCLSPMCLCPRGLRPFPLPIRRLTWHSESFHRARRSAAISVLLKPVLLNFDVILLLRGQAGKTVAALAVAHGLCDGRLVLVEQTHRGARDRCAACIVHRSDEISVAARHRGTVSLRRKRDALGKRNDGAASVIRFGELLDERVRRAGDER